MAEENSRYRQHRPLHISSPTTDHGTRPDRLTSPSSPTRPIPPPTSEPKGPASAPSTNLLHHHLHPSAPASPQNAHADPCNASLSLQPSGPRTTATNAANVWRPRKVIADYRLTKTLGQGSMGKVKLAIHLTSGHKRACKIISRPPGSNPVLEPVSIGPTASIRDFPAASIDPIAIASMTTRSPAGTKQAEDSKNNKEIRIIREAAIMLLLRHPHICALYDLVLLDEFYYMFFEYVNGGQLLDYIISHGKLKENNARRFVRQIVSAVDYCHQNSIVHRDLKIENVLIDRHGNIKLIDFGLSNLYSPDSQLQTFCGSLYFAAPELLNAKAYTGPEVDIWSLGIILYVLVCGRVPFDDTSMPVLHSKIKAGHVEFPSHLSHECKHLILRMLVTHPAQRASMLEVKTHPWMVKGHDGPPDNYLPVRPPLALPLDLQVIEQMKGFEFGSSEHIRVAIEEQIARGGQLQMFGAGDRNSAPETPLTSIYYLVKEKLEREHLYSEPSGVGMNETPARSLEDMEWDSTGGLRTPAKSNVTFSSSSCSSSNSYSQQHPDEKSTNTFAYTAPTSPTIARSMNQEASLVRARANSTGSVLRWDEEGRPPAAPSGPAIQPDSNREDVKLMAAAAAALRKIGSAVKNARDGRDDRKEGRRERSENFGRLSRTMPRGHSTSNSLGSNSAMSNTPSTSPRNNAGGILMTANTSRRKSGVKPMRSQTSFGFQRQQRDFGTDMSGSERHSNNVRNMSSGNNNMITSSNPANTSNTQQDPSSPRALNADTVSEPPLGHTLHKSETDRRRRSMQLDPYPTSDLPSTITSAMPCPPSAATAPSAPTALMDSHTNTNRLGGHIDSGSPNEVDTDTGSRRGRADEAVRPVYLKGLFTVVNTSTKPASVIRQDLIRVLAMNGIHSEEYRGGFTCEYTPSVTGLVDGEKEKESRWKRLGDKMDRLGERTAQRLSDRAPFGGGTGGFRDRTRSRDRGDMRFDRTARSRDRAVNRQRDRERIEAFWARERGQGPSSSAAGDLELPKSRSTNYNGKNGDIAGPHAADENPWYASDDGGISGNELEEAKGLDRARRKSSTSSVDDLDYDREGPFSPGYVDLSTGDGSRDLGSPELPRSNNTGESHDNDLMFDGVDVSDARHHDQIEGLHNRINSCNPNNVVSQGCRESAVNTIHDTDTTQPGTLPSTGSAESDATTTSPSVAFATLPVPDLSVRFEVFIVKIPWLGLHGVQFRRIGGGDIWQYKAIANRILEDLKL
ncbi:hypothetical protein SeMB42_g01042 [Synchytrium endobioticum]|uniref:non-specific serine/threonine protein kinase n=1 Tax=Synchytrium endobioticum TaxID=286115 RepID=A0A507DNQ6_9FUNG|nr:hypothetical protein SeLEV6574_g00488 [Synchytrium endobioticum]TPX53041.1 hypothetical protein SeMB42_g01042 [Synchytrium endobioticum]